MTAAASRGDGPKGDAGTMIIRRWVAVGLLALAGCSSSDSGTPDGGGGGAGGTGGDAAGGVGGAGGGGVEAGPGMPCGVAEMEPNDSRDKAVPYTVGASVVGCVGTGDDVDFYELTAPATDPAGGYYQGSVTDVGDGTLEVKVYSATDNSEIVGSNYTTDAGASLFFYWAAAPGQKYRLAVSRFGGFTNPYRYTLKASYTKVNDSYEPNDTRDMARPLTLGAPLMAYFFSGFRGKDIKAEEYQDWYSVTLAAGRASFKVESVPMNVRPQIKVYDAAGGMVAVADSYNVTPGGSIITSAMIETPGMHRVVIDVFSVEPEAGAKAMTVPESFTHPYTLTVSQP
jgi:hypothetical protein